MSFLVLRAYLLLILFDLCMSPGRLPSGLQQGAALSDEPRADGG